MANIILRRNNGGPLSNDQLDSNFDNLNNDKAEVGANTDITSLGGVTGGIAEVDYIDFDLDATSSFRVGRLRWNDSDKCLEVDASATDGTSTMQLGQELVIYAYNAEGTQINNGDVVYLHSSAGEIAAVKKFVADDSIDPRLVVGIATQDIPVAGNGFICRSGYVRGLDTSAFEPADEIYASAVTAGGVSNSRPVSPNRVVDIGICLESDSTNGIILVQVDYSPRAENISYNSADSNLTATNVKSALDELDLVKADISIIQSNVTFYLTNANEGVIPNYRNLVTTTVDPDFDDVAIDYLTAEILSTPTLIGSWISDPDVLTGDVAGIVIPFVSNVRKDSGSGDPAFYIEVYVRDDLGAETLLTTSNQSDHITSTSYVQISLAANISLQNFTDTDRVVVKMYGQTVSSSAFAEVQLGGVTPARALFPVPVSVIPNVASASEIIVDTTNFGDKLSGTDDSVQAALDTLDDHTHPVGDITGLTTSTISTNTTQFDGLLSVLDTDIQKALNTLDNAGLAEVTGVNATTTNAITINASLDVDNVKIDGNTISTTDLNGNLTLAPNGTGTVVMNSVDVGGGAIDGTTIGATVAAAVNATTLDVATSASFAGATIDDLGTVATADINGGTIDGVSLQATIATVDNVEIDGNTIQPRLADTNGSITIQGRGTGTVVLPGVDINSGSMDGVTIGAGTAAAATVTNLTATGTINFTGATISDLGTVTTADINGGTIDGANITVPFGSTLDVSGGTLTLSDDQISGDKIAGGSIGDFASTGIDDNATLLTMIIDASHNTLFQRTATENATATVEALNGFSAQTGTTAGLNLVDTALLSTASEGTVGTVTNHPFHIETNGTPAIYVDTAQNVGIGTSGVNDYQLHIENSGGGASMGVISSITGTSTINLGDTALGNDGALSYDNNTQTLTLRSASTNVLTSTGAAMTIAPAITANSTLTATGLVTANAGATIVGALTQTVGDVNFDAGTFFVDASTDSVGVGNTLPNAKLSVLNGADADIIFRIDGADTTTEYIALGVNGGNGVITAGNATGAGTGLKIRTADNSGIETERLFISPNGNFGLSTTPKASTGLNVPTLNTSVWQINGYSSTGNRQLNLLCNSYYDSSFKLLNADGASRIAMSANEITLGVAPSGLADGAASFVEGFRVDVAGRVSVGNTSPASYDVFGGQHLIVGSGSGRSTMMLLSSTSSTGQIFFGDGVGAATYRGFIEYDHSSDSMSLAASGSRVAYIKNGNFGIASSDPGVKLDVVGGAFVAAFTNSGAGRAQGHILYSDANGAYYGQNTGSNGLSDFSLHFNRSGNYLRMIAGGVEAMRINGSRVFGFGEDDPKSDFRHILEVSDSGSSIHGGGSTWSASQYLYLSNNAYYEAPSWKAKRTNPSAQLIMFNDEFIFKQAATTAIDTAISYTDAAIIDSSGNFGVGETNPLARIHLRGNMYLQDGGSIYAGGGSAAQLVSNEDPNGNIVLNGFNSQKYQQNVGTNSHRWYRGTSSVAGATAIYEEMMHLDGNGRLGVGNTNPAGFNFQGGDSHNLVVGDVDDSNIITIASSPTGTGYLAFGDSTTGVARYAGLIEYAHSTDQMIFRTASTARGRFTSGGNFLVGTSNAVGRVTATTNGTFTIGSIGTYNFTCDNIVGLAGGASGGYLQSFNGLPLHLNQAGNSVYSVGIYNTTGGTTANVQIDAGGLIRRVTSSRRFKNSITDYVEGGAFDDIRPVFYRTNDQDSDDERLHVGLIAEELDEAGFTEFVGYDEAGEPESVNYMNMVALCIKEIQSLRARVAELEGK